MNAPAEKPFIGELEQEVLGSLLVEDAYPRVANILSSKHFLDPLHAIIFDYIRVAHERYGVTNPVVVHKIVPTEEAAAIGARHNVRLSECLAKLAAACTYGPNRIEYSARRVVEQWARLSLATEAASLHAAASDPRSNPVDLVTGAGQAFDDILADVRRGPKRKTRVSISEAAENSFLATQEAMERGSGLTGMTWGLTDVNRLTGGIQRRDLTLVAARPSMGKAQPLTAKIRTPTGWKAMGDLRLGDRVSSVDGEESRVTGIFPQGRKQIYRVAFSDGRSTRACADHLWRVYYRSWPEPRTLTTAEVAAKLSKARYQRRIWIDMPVASGDPHAAPTIDPWVLGALLGDGGFSGGGIRFSTACEETVERMADRLPAACRIDRVGSTAYQYTITMQVRARTLEGWPKPNHVKEALKSLGLLGLTSEAKFVPSEYLNGSAEQRLDLLRGLLDTDGWVERHGSVCFATVSPKLAEDVCELARSIGAWCSIRSRQKYCVTGDERKAGLPSYVCVISHSHPESLFLMSSKVARTKDRARRKLPTFASISADGFEEAQCITVSHPSHLYVTDDYIVTHNSTLGLSCAIRAAKSGVGVGFVSLEMDSDKLGARAISDLAYDWHVKVPYADLIRGRIEPAALDAVRSASREVDKIPLWIEDQSGLSMTDIRVKTESLLDAAEKAGTPLGALFIDHIGLIKPSARYQGNRTNEVAEITAGLKSLAREYGLAVVALSQLSRALESRNDKRPQLSDLRDSGAIEQDADTIIFLYREAYYLEREKGGSAEQQADRTERLLECQNKLEFHIAKQRNGPVTSVDLFCDMACSAVRNGVHQ